MKPYTEFLVNTVFEAATLLTDDFFVAAKDQSGDLVTSFDFELERFITAKIRNHFPKFDIISEEFNPKQTLTSNCFVIDPLDGTINFAHGLPLFGIQVAMVKRGKTISSVIYLPRLRELYFADECGAFLVEDPTQSNITKNAHRIRVSSTAPDKALYLVEGGDKFAALARLDKKTRHWRYICCTAVNHAWTARGRLGGTILRKDNLWDYLPGQYLVKQAGGHITNKKGAHVAANTKAMAKMLLQEGRL